MKKSALFFDIDGTLTNNDTGQIWRSGMEAIEKVREKGHLAFINTGRTFCCIQEPIRKSEFDGFLCGCGTQVLYRGEELFRYTIDGRRGREIADCMLDCKIDAILEGSDRIYYSVEKSRFRELEFIRDMYKEYGLGKDRISGMKEILYDKFFIVTDEESNVDGFFAEIREDMDIIDRERGRYEIVPKGFSKATAIQFVQNEFGIDSEDVYVFGDSTNDLPMFEYGVHTIAMGEHAEELEEHTEFITRNVEDDGLAYALEHYGFL